MLLTPKTGDTGLSYHKEETESSTLLILPGKHQDKDDPLHLSSVPTGGNKEQVPAEETGPANTVQTGCRKSDLCQLEVLCLKLPLEQQGEQCLLMRQQVSAVTHCTAFLLKAHGIIHMLAWHLGISFHIEESNSSLLSYNYH